MLVLHINTTIDSRNGVGQIVRGLVNAASDYGCEASVLTGRGDFSIIRKGRLRLNALMARTFGDDGFLRSSLHNSLRSLRPDVVHLHNLHGYYTNLPQLADTLCEMDVPVVVTLHDLWLFSPRAAWPLPDCGLKNYPSRWWHGKSRLEEKQAFLQKLPNLEIVVPTHTMAEMVNATGADFSLNVIPNGVDLDVFRPMPELERKEKRLLAVATKWNETKGLSDIQKLAEQLPNDWEMAMIGKGVPRSLRIRNLGVISDPHLLAKYMAESTALISAAHQESFGMTVAEALATHTPVLVRKGTAPYDLLGVENERFAVDFSNPREIIDTLPRLRDFSFTESVQSISQMADMYYNLYKKMVEG